MNPLKTLLNVGGNSKNILLPKVYEDWKHILLDIDPSVQPDIVCDARELIALKTNLYDVVYCSHNLEHYYPHEIPKVLDGFKHVVKTNGAIDIHVPDIGELLKTVVQNKLDIDDVLYESKAGPIKVSDVLYGYHVEIAESGNDFFSHKCGFTIKFLEKVLRENGFTHVYLGTAKLEIRAVAFLQSPNSFFQQLYQLPASL